MKKTLWWLAALLAVMVLAGCDPEPGDDDDDDEDVFPDNDVQITLSVTNIPQETTILSAVLQNEITGPNQAPAAISQSVSNGTISFRQFQMPPTNPQVPFTKLGNYYITVSDSGQSDSGNQWRYAGKTSATVADVKKYRFGTATNTIDWSLFVQTRTDP